MAYIDKYGVEYSDDKKTLVKCPKELTGEYSIIDGVEFINEWAFGECHLQSIDIPKSVREIGDKAFWGCHSLSQVIIPRGVIFIGEEAFHWCSKLSYVQIPFSVSEIKKCAFSGCVRLKNIEVSPYNENYSDVNGILFNKQKTKLIQCPPKSISSTYIVPSYVQEIGTEAFAACEKLRKIVLPNSITRVEEHVFVDCSLNSIIVPKGEIQRFAAMDELNFYCGILTEDDIQNLSNTPATMLKNIFYGALSFLCVTLAFCAISFVHTYKKPKVSTDIHGFKYETIVDNEQEGAKACKEFYKAINEEF